MFSIMINWLALRFWICHHDDRNGTITNFPTWNPSMGFSGAAHKKLNRFSDLDMGNKCCWSVGDDDGLDGTCMSDKPLH